jgi:hypothetical protein
MRLPDHRGSPRVTQGVHRFAGVEGHAVTGFEHRLGTGRVQSSRERASSHQSLVPAVVIAMGRASRTRNRFGGPFEETGWRLAGTLVPIAYFVWSLWLVVAGLTLVLG